MTTEFEDLQVGYKTDLAKTTNILKSLFEIQRRKLSVTFHNNLWSIFDNKGEIASSNTLLSAIKKV